MSYDILPSNNLKYFLTKLKEKFVVKDENTLGNLNDVQFSNLRDGQIPKYNSTLGKFVNRDDDGGGGMKVGDVTGATASTSQGTASVTLTWTDPNDIEVSGVKLAEWEGTLLIRKVGSAPTNRNDGTVIIDSKTRNQYSSTGYVDDTVSFGTHYYYRFFPYTTGGLYTDGSTVDSTPSKILVSIPVPSSTLTYSGIQQTMNFTYDSSKVSISGVVGINAGSYNATAHLLDTNTCTWEDGSITDKTIPWSITRAKTSAPTVTGSFTYDGTQKTATVSSYDSNIISVTGITGTNANTYTATISLIDNNYEWTDETTTDKTATWTIEKATGGCTLTPSSVTLDANHLTGSSVISNATGTVARVTSSDAHLSASLTGNTINLSYNDTASKTINVSVFINASDNYEAAEVILEVKCTFTSVMTVKIDMSDTNPLTWATYYDDAVGMTAGSSDWDSFIGHYPCLLKNGVEQGKLDPNDFSKYEDGTNADITSGDAGDVMIAFPRRGLKMSVSGNILTISVTNEDNATGFDYSAFSYKGSECSIVYQSAYEGYYDGTKLRSLSGKTPTVNQTIGTFRTQAQANGTGYEQRTYFPLTYTQCLYLLKYKGQNAQIAIGRGYVDGNSSAHSTGTTNTKGMDWGETTGKQACKLFGIEDFWGNIWDLIDGILSNASYVCSVSDGNFNNTGSGYISTNSPSQSSNINGYFSRVNDNVTPQMGFLPNPTYKSSGSDTTYFCDSASVGASRLAFFGGGWGSGSGAGVFLLDVGRTASSTYAYCGGRLSYFKLKS